MAVLVVALVIDIMKPASLGFALPGMIDEYGVSRATASLLAFFALVGTVLGSFVWGVVADIYGRQASILLLAVVFVGTSICGALPSLAWNIRLFFLMGAAAGGMLPVTIRRTLGAGRVCQPVSVPVVACTVKKQKAHKN